MSFLFMFFLKTAVTLAFFLCSDFSEKTAYIEQIIVIMMTMMIIIIAVVFMPIVTIVGTDIYHVLSFC